MASTEIGRATTEQMEDGVMYDAPNAQVAAIMTQLDTIVDLLKVVAAEEGWVDTSGGVAALDKIKLKI